MGDPDEYVRQTAVEYYGRLAGDEGTSRLVEAVSDRNSSVRFNALMALGDRLTSDLLPVVESLLGDPDEYVRQTAVEYYGRLS